jgi:hypothetical protein
MDLYFPERNREVVLETVINFEHDKDVFDGFVIFMSVDVRDAMVDNNITAHLISPTEILLTMPSLAFDLYHDSVGRNERLREFLGMECVQLQLAQNITINEIRMTHTRQTKRLLLRFPNTVRLSNVWDPSTFVLSGEMQTEYTSYKVGTIDVPLLLCRMKWQIGNMETHRRAKVSAAALSNVAQLEAQFKRMFATNTTGD